MSYDFEKSNSNYASANTTVITAYPFTMSCWFKAESIADKNRMFCLGKTTDGVPLAALHFNGSSQLVAWRRNYGGNTLSSTVATTVSTGTWYLATFVYTGRYSFQAFLNSTAGNEVTTDMGDWNAGNDDLNVIGIGALVRAGVQDYFDGKIAEAAIWKSALTSGNVASLAGGAPANTVGSNLWGWWRMNSDQGTSLTDSAGSTTITVSASGLYSADHPTISAGATTKPAYYYAQL